MEMDAVLCECENEALVQLVTNLESELLIEIVVAPKLGMTMVQAEDSIDFQPFYLGEVLITECQVLVNGQLGYGYCMGDAPQKAYSIAVMDAIMHTEGHPKQNDINAFIEIEKAKLLKKQLEEYNQVLKTKVDFKIMEQD
jgi:alpha-D-ribose 1-methylphosphonate 5-triphosphate synthase subunit PhnG